MASTRRTTDTPAGTLTDDEAVQFYRILWSLYAYGVRALGLDGPADPDEVRGYDPNRIVAVREAVFEDRGFIGSFVERNPFNLSAEDLEIVATWRDAIIDSVVIERILKSGAIVLAGRSVYRVSGLRFPFDEVAELTPPVVVRMAILPFGARLVYDGYLTVYKANMGSNMRRSFANEYRSAKRRGAIITRLDGADSNAERPTPRHYRAQLDELEKIARTLRATAGDRAGTGDAFSLIRAAIDVARAVTDPAGEWPACERAIAKSRRAVIAVAREAFSDPE